MFKNASFGTHNFGSCNYTDVWTEHFADVIRSCGWNAKTCSKDCKYYVDKMDSHRCMQGFEAKILRGMMKKANANETAKAVYNARETCAKAVTGKANKMKMQMSFIPFAMLVYFAFNA